MYVYRDFVAGKHAARTTVATPAKVVWYLPNYDGRERSRFMNKWEKRLISRSKPVDAAVFRTGSAEQLFERMNGRLAKQPGKGHWGELKPMDEREGP